MSLGGNIRQWRNRRRLSTADVAQRAGLESDTLDLIEADASDPTASTLTAIAAAIGIPSPWLFAAPDQIAALERGDADDASDPAGAIDPVTEHILKASDHERELFALLAALVAHGEPKQLRAAEMSLRSLIKQTRQSPLPWLNRQPGNFEPPSD